MKENGKKLTYDDDNVLEYLNVMNVNLIVFLRAFSLLSFFLFFSARKKEEKLLLVNQNELYEPKTIPF